MPKKDDALPPVIDLEYDSNDQHLQQRAAAEEIQAIYDRLRQHYGKQPIFYISKAFYNIVLAGEFKAAPLWVREYQGKPDLKDNPDWLFWQR